jgi:drug/metabolite transporter (DMT)-like permease
VKGSTRLALLSLHVALAAGTYVLSKLATDGFPSVEALTLARALGTTLLLLLLTGTLVPKPDFDGRTWARLFGLGVLVVPVNQYLFLRGLKDSVPGHSALLYALTPLGILLLSSVVHRSLPPRRSVVGVLLALLGAVVVLRPWARGETVSQVRRGDLLLLLAVVAWVFYTVAIRGLCRRHDARTVTAWTLILGTLAMLPVGGTALKELHWSAIPTTAWCGLAWMITITSVTMMLLWGFLLRHLDPVQVSICMNAQPPATALLQTALASAGLVAFPEPLGWAFLVGMVLVIAGSLLVQRSPTSTLVAEATATAPAAPD